MSQALPRVTACVFDAYGTLFDINAAAARCKAELGPRWQVLSDLWRQKQLQYTWLRSLMDRYVDFWQVTGDALDYALEASKIDDPDLRRRLMDIYMRLDAYPEARDMLLRLRGGGLKTAILSNGSPGMLEAAVEGAGLSGLFDAVISVDALKVYKPAVAVYRQLPRRMGDKEHRIAFLSANGWDAAAAAAYGFQAIWVNRAGLPWERLDASPAAVIDSLAALPALLRLP
ncbi:MAG: haloacid dehalogenase type II [Alphaproteobacteria bacterium]|nr:haloacid dehalogenase type II [Alphaproteobacteria bacterium]